MKRISYGIILLFQAAVFAALNTTTAHAQLTPAWSQHISQIEWLRVTSLGYPVIGSTGQITALDPNTGATIWENNRLGTVGYDQVEDVWGTPYLKITYNMGPVDDALPEIALVDVTTGKVLFDSREESLGVLGSYALAKSGRFMVVGVKPGQFSAKLLMYDMGTGKKLWENDELFKGGSEGKGGFLAKVAGALETLANMRSLTAEPLEVDDEHIIITHPSYVIKLKSADGTTVWRSKIEESTTANVVFANERPGVVFVGAETENESMMTSDDGEAPKTYLTNYYAFDINTGESVWSSPVRNNNERLNYMVPTPGGILIMPGVSGNAARSSLNLLDYATGDGLWGKKGRGIKTNGQVIDILPTDNGFVISSAAGSVFQNKDDNYFINALNVADGTLRFEKSVKVKGRLMHTETTPKGVLYTTTHEVNILDLNSGTNVLEDPIESGGPKRMDRALPFPTVTRDNKLYVFATKEGRLKELDKTTGTVRTLNTAALELGGKEVPKSLTAYDEGIVLCSDQNVVMVGYDGLLKFNHYFAPPKQSGFMRALAIAEAIKGAYVTAVLAAATVAAADIAASTSDPGVRETGAALGTVTGGLAAYSLAYTGKALADFNKRFKATTNTDDFLMVLSEVARRDFRLLQVDKRTGKTIQSLDLGKDRDPVYDLDLLYGHVYHQSRPGEISCFKLNE